VEHARVHAQRLAHHPAHAPAQQVLAHRLAGRKHQIEAPVQMAGVAPRRSGGGTRQTRCGQRGGQALDVGVAEGDHRHAAALADVQRGPGEAVRVARFDQVGRHRRQPFGEHAPLPRQPVAAAAGHGQRGQALHRRVARRTRHGRRGDGVAPVALLRHPLPLGAQVAAHTAAGRAPEHGGVDHMGAVRRVGGGSHAPR